MSDEMRFILIITEGPHDVAAISKVFRVRGYEEINNKNEIPYALQRTIPTTYPFQENGWMDRGVPRPCFLKYGNCYIVIINAGGVDIIGDSLSRFMDLTSLETLQMLQGIAIIADMDIDTLETKQKRIIKQILNIEGITAKIVEPLEGLVFKEDESFPLKLFFFPDNNVKGTLEILLLDGARAQYQDLYCEAVEYIDRAKKNYKLRNSDGLKATVGVIANVLKPGRANQVSIQDDKWFTKESLDIVPSHSLFAVFLDSLLKLF